MPIIKKEIEVSKEIDDCFELLVSVVKAAKSGKPVGEIAGGELQHFITAMDGISSVAEEATHKEAFLRTIGYRSGELAAAFIGSPQPSA